MNQIKTGKFISAMRKSKNLTQRQLAEKLNISDKTVSKWECGNGMPEVSLMLPLCEILEINVNELLSGEKIDDGNYHRKAEENMMNLIKEKEENRKKLIISFINAIMGTSMLVVCILVAGYTENLSPVIKVLLIIFGVLMMILGLCVAVVLDRETGTYECPECHAKFTPDMKSYIMGVHTLTKRKLKCPECGKTKYCKHIISK
ncbi:MAG: helix-turn-helix transcriptional regulator [Oscillospiraceae bacterium]|nr:helix-turn-helix transcriptional regulator [Oscillospiraceae bacterium]